MLVYVCLQPQVYVLVSHPPWFLRQDLKKPVSSSSELELQVSANRLGFFCFALFCFNVGSSKEA